RAQTLPRGDRGAARRRRARALGYEVGLGAALLRRDRRAREDQAERRDQHRLQHDGRVRRGVRRGGSVLRGRLSERGGHASGVGGPPVHLLRGRGLRAVSRGRTGRAERRRARQGDARDPETGDLREILARRANPASPALARAQRGTLPRRHRVRILVVVQRYGAEVVGGSESHARVVAHRLAMVNEVEVATTNALDYWSWAPHFPEGESMDGPVRVRRFAVTGTRSPTFKDAERHVLFEPHTLADEQAWLATQGPHAPGLLEFLRREGKAYDAALFYTYIYEPTAAGLPLVAERAALISTAHDEEPLRLVPYRALFQLPRAFGFLTPEERALVQARFKNAHIPSEVLGIGLDPPPWHDPAPFRERYAPRGPVVLYLGQISE